MKVALASNLVTHNIDHNLEDILSLSRRASSIRADLILFPEMAITGMINNNDPTHDLPIGMELSDPRISRLKEVSSDLKLWLAIGILEHENGKLFDSAILLNPSGELVLHYRRINPQWHGSKADPLVYCQGTTVQITDTPFGRFAFLICGDLFDDIVIAQLRGEAIDYLLFPFARCFADESIDQARWDCSEMPEYQERVRKIGIPTLMTNYIADDGIEDDGSFGGAFVIDKNGSLIASLPLGKPGLLIVDL